MTVLEKIMNGSLDVFVENGFDKSSITLITKRAKVSNGAIYHHFKSKDDIITKLYIEVKIELGEYIKENLNKELNYKEKIYTIWASMIKWGTNNNKKKKFLDMFTSSPYYLKLDKACIEVIFCFFNELIEDGVKLGYLRKMDTEFLYLLTGSFTDGCINYLIKFPEKEYEKFLNEAFTSYWRAIADI